MISGEASLVDQAQFQVALINLAVNGRDALPDGGVFRVQTCNIVASDGKAGESVTVTISDIGQGMTPDVLSRAGEPFFSTKAEVGRGTGLGLAQVLGFVQQSGGHGEIKSEVGRGTVIKLTLPRAKASAIEPPREPSFEPARTRSMSDARGNAHVLLVDDNLQVAEVAAAVLTEAGYQVTKAPGGASAPGEFEQKRFSLIFSDLGMPGMSGLELARELATGYSDAAQNAIHEGYEVVSKPYLPATLVDAVQRLIAVENR